MKMEPKMGYSSKRGILKARRSWWRQEGASADVLMGDAALMT